MWKRVLAVAVLVGGLLSALVFSQRRTVPLRVSGLLESDEIRLGSRIGGRVAKVHVQEGEKVAAGQILVELEPFDLNERLAQAQKEAAARQAELAQFESGFRAEEVAQARSRLEQFQAVHDKLKHGPRTQEIEAAQARLRLAKAELEQAQLDVVRERKLFEKGGITQSEMDRFETALKVARESTAVREAELNLLLEGTRSEDLKEAEARQAEAEAALNLRQNGYREEEVAAARAAWEAATAQVRVLETQRQELAITAPTAGIVEAIELQPGDLVPPNAPVMSLADRGRLWVRAYVPENQLSVTIGQRVTVTVDSFPQANFAGRIAFVARQAEFTPGNVQTPEERSKQVFRIKVQLETGLEQLRPGMSADVWLDRRPE